jgi:hypothetical protein
MCWSFVYLIFLLFAAQVFAKNCTLSPLGVGKDDTDQVDEGPILYLPPSLI